MEGRRNQNDWNDLFTKLLHLSRHDRRLLPRSSARRLFGASRFLLAGTILCLPRAAPRALGVPGNLYDGGGQLDPLLALTSRSEDMRLLRRYICDVSGVGGVSEDCELPGER